MPAYNQLGEQTLTVSTAAVGLTLPLAADGENMRVSHGTIYVGGQPVRYRSDGTAPTSTTGMYVAAGSYIDCTDPGTDYWRFFFRAQFIRDTTATGNATLEIEYVN